MQEHRSTLAVRPGEVEEVAAALRATGSAARTVLVTGPVGTGKTAVLEQARWAVVQEGGRVLRLRWEVAEGPDGAAALVDVVCAALAKIFSDGRLPARIAEVRRMRALTTDPGGEIALLSALADVMTDAVQYVHFAITLDNVRSMPMRTACALGLLLRAFRPTGVPMVLAGRPMDPGQVAGAQLLATADLVLELQSLSSDAVGALIVRWLGRPVEPDLVTQISHALGPLAGSAGAVLSVLASLEECGALLELDGQVCLTVPEGGLPLSADIAELRRYGWPDTSPDASTVATAVALARLGAPQLESLYRTKSPDGLLEALGRRVEGLIRDRVVTVDADGRAGFAVPALAAALRALPDRGGAQPPYAMVTRALADQLGAVVPDPGRPWPFGDVLARDPTPAETIPKRPTAPHGVQSERSGAVGHEGPAPYGADVPGALRESAVIGLRRSDHIGVLSLGEPMLACIEESFGSHQSHSEVQGPLVFVARAWALMALHEHRSPHSEDADPRYRAALGRMPTAAGLAALGGAYGIGPVTPMTFGPAAAGYCVPDAGLGSRLVPSPAEVRLLAAAAGGDAEFQRARQELLHHTIDEAALHRLRNAAAYGDLAGALNAALGERYTRADESTAAQYQALLSDYLTGEWDSALSRARRIEARGQSDGVAGVAQPARALAAEIQLMRGQFGRARQWLELIPPSFVHPLVARVRLGVRYWSGQPDEALAGAWRDVRRAQESGLLAGVERVLLRIMSLTAGDSAETARDTLRHLEALHEEAASPMTHEAVLLGRGMVHGDAESALSAYHLVRQRVDLPLSVDCCQSLTDVGDDPSRWLAEAARSVHTLGMGRPVRSPLGAAAVRRNVSLPRRRTTSQGLSEQEVRLIGMVSEGSTNRQIAARLAWSEKTVEQRLSQLFQRTGRRSRVELAAAWLDGSLARQGLVPDAGSGSDGGD
ncbi:LuxR C-terminal-related transcriptional regulator [Streptomyces sp. NPDC005423]|uniref:LuxR C-terminal-related transcriptional regulator n=1 Tax=Streptomyces sp. NPDC005423 TaxID=3155343 RepID=UPI0033A0AC08